MKTVSIDEATEQLRSPAQHALQGEPVFIEIDSRILLLQAIPALPVAPPGFYDEIYDEEYHQGGQANGTALRHLP